MLYIKWYVGLYWLPNHVWSSASSANLIHLTLLGMIYESMAPIHWCFEVFVSGIAHQTGVDPWSSMDFLNPHISFGYIQATSTRKLLHQPPHVLRKVSHFWSQSSPHFLELKSSASDSWILQHGDPPSGHRLFEHQLGPTLPIYESIGLTLPVILWIHELGMGFFYPFEYIHIINDPSMVGVYQSIRGDWPPDGLTTAGSGGNGIGLGKKMPLFAT